MKLSLKDSNGKSIGTMEFPVQEVAKSLSQSLSKSLESDAQLHEAELKGSREKVVELEEKLANAEARTMDDFTPIEKANFVIAWAKGISPEDKAIFCEAVGIPIAQATEAEVAEAEGEPKIIQGRTDKEEYRYLEYLNLSVKGG